MSVRLLLLGELGDLVELHEAHEAAVRQREQRGRLLGSHQALLELGHRVGVVAAGAELAEAHALVHALHVVAVDVVAVVDALLVAVREYLGDTTNIFLFPEVSILP